MCLKNQEECVGSYWSSSDMSSSGPEPASGVGFWISISNNSPKCCIKNVELCCYQFIFIYVSHSVPYNE